MPQRDLDLDRRQLLRALSAFGGGAALSALLPTWARSQTPGLAAAHPLGGPEIALRVDHTPLTIDGRRGHGVAINGSVPGPLIRLKQGQTARIALTNGLPDEATSIHWHGVLVPFQMDGVPGVSFPGVKPGETFVYEFPVRHAGTFWYHSHSGLQELIGHYAPLIFDPAEPDPVAYDREHVLVLSDYSFLHPHELLTKLKKEPGYFNRQKQTVAALLAGRDQPLEARMAWAAMRMDPTDILDVTGSTYRYLINGHGPRDNWTGLFQPGERVRLRLINAGAMTLFNVRIPGVRMTVVQADGENVQPVVVDELQIANAETFDVVVMIPDDRAYTVVAEAADGSGLGRATLAPRPGMTAEVPPPRPRKVLAMRDMGMDMSGGPAAGSAQGGHSMPAGGMDMGGMDMGGAEAADHAGGGHSMAMRDPRNAPQVKLTPGVQMIAPMPIDRTGDKPTGLEDAPGKVLTYRDLVALAPDPHAAPPTRQLEVHLTGNMERFMWSFDGVKYSDGAEPLPFRLNERVRVILVNDTMMNHPIHLHGHFIELVNGAEPGRQPRKHTVNVMPGAKLAFDLTADAPGDWAFHCHMLLHMHAGMFRVVTVRPPETA